MVEATVLFILTVFKSHFGDVCLSAGKVNLIDLRCNNLTGPIPAMNWTSFTREKDCFLTALDVKAQCAANGYKNANRFDYSCPMDDGLRCACFSIVNKAPCPNSGPVKPCPYQQ